MKISKFLLLSGMLLVSTSVFSLNTKHCVNLVSEWGKKCNSTKSLQKIAENNCSEDVYIKMCIEKSDGKWSCSSVSKFKPNAKASGFYTCHATGKYEWASCTGGREECGFPDPTSNAKD